MRYVPQALALAAFAIGIGFASDGFADVIIDTGGYAKSMVADPPVFGGEDWNQTGLNGFTSSATMNVDYGANLYAHASYILGPDKLEADTNLQRPGSSGSAAETSGQINFEVNNDTTSYAVFDSLPFSVPPGAQVVMWVQISDAQGYEAGNYALDYFNYIPAGGATGTLAPGGPSETVQTFGTGLGLSGGLKSGTKYYFSWDARIAAPYGPDTGSTSLGGQLGITFADSSTSSGGSSVSSAAAPLPSTASAGIALIGGAGLLLQRRRRRQTVA